MSLIAFTEKDGFPILLGDVLFSATDNLSNVEIPVYLKSFPEIKTNQNVFFDSLKQKTYVINDQLALCMGGYLFEMKRLLEDIKLHFSYTRTNYENLVFFWREYNKEIFQRSACLFLLAEKEKKQVVFKTLRIGEWEKSYSNMFGNVFAFGTGSERFIEEILSFPEITINHHDNFQNLKALHNILVCRFIGSEYFSGSSLNDSWGAGFEMISHDGNKFIKNDDTGYLIWNCKIDQYGNTDFFPALAIDYKYYGDVLVITVNNFRKAKMYGVLGIDKNVNEIDLNSLPVKYRFSTKRVSCCVRYELPDGTIKISSFYLEKPDGMIDDYISVSINDACHTEIKIGQKLQEEFENEITRLIQSIK